jgi:hypothetical protein
LDDLHGGVQVHAERIRTHVEDHGGELVARERLRLHGPDVAKDERRWRHVSHLVRCSAIAVLSEHRALAAQAKTVAALLRDARELAIDVAGSLGTARHRGDEQRSPELLAEQGDGRIDRVEIELREGVVDELDVFEKRCLGSESHVTCRTELDVIGFPSGNVGHDPGKVSGLRRVCPVEAARPRKPC